MAKTNQVCPWPWGWAAFLRPMSPEKRGGYQPEAGVPLRKRKGQNGFGAAYALRGTVGVRGENEEEHTV